MNENTLPTKRHLDVLSLIVTLAPIAPIAFDTWGIVYYRQGLRNEPMDFAPGVLLVAIATSLCIAVLLVRTWTLHRAGDSRATLSWLMFVLALMAWPAVLVTNPRPVAIYTRGFAEWSRRTVDVAGIRQWRAASPDRQPPIAFEKLQPTKVEEHPTGVVLQWGQLAVMPGKQRKLFIGDAPSSTPPDEGRDFWQPVSPGVYVGVHGKR